MFLFLSALDLLAGICGLVNGITMIQKANIFNNITPLKMIAYSLQDMSCFVFTIISILRLIKIIKPFYRVTHRKLAVFPVAGITKSIAQGIILVKLNNYNSLGVVNLILGIGLFLTIVLIVSINLFSHYSLKNTARQRKRNTTAGANPYSADAGVSKIQNDNKETEPKNKALVTLLIITFFYVLCEIPMAIDLIIVGLSTMGYLNATKAMEEFFYISFMLLFLNGGINSMIYTIRSKEIKNCIKDLTKRVTSYVINSFR